MKEREILRVSVRPSSSSASFSGSFAPPDLGTLDRAGLPPAGFPSSHHILAPWSRLIQRTRGTLALCYFWSASIGKKALDATPPSSKDAVKRGRRNGFGWIPGQPLRLRGGVFTTSPGPLCIPELRQAGAWAPPGNLTFTSPHKH